MDWKIAIDTFEERRLAIWEKMPQDVYNLSQGIVPGDTNVYGQYVTTMLYADSELRTLCDEVLFYLTETAKEASVDLATLIAFSKKLLDYKQKFFVFTGVPMASEMLRMYLDALDSLENLEQFIDLTNAALKYFNRHHMWVDLIMPWGVYNGFAKQDFSKYL
ncbi:cucumopine synthase-related protein [Faecalispora sporosphaeroides]|uniref:Cucumopine synthase C-terminal helical bundle domain-containing protein n=2 Tax=Faecalispora sporosphaeroides TaxID=1549 RepID=A0A928KWW6_9FIRM|nr:hypothetical protein [Faecalispora sporosphaeroides]MBE6833530.1 hypothetical protein [Faecalispora sporosphaeroides]